MSGLSLLLLGAAYLIGTGVLVLLYKATGVPARNQAGCLELLLGLFCLYVIVYLVASYRWGWLTAA